MRRAPYVIAGTIAGIVAVLAFPVDKPHVTITSAGTTTGSGSTPTSGTTSTVPPRTAPSTSTPTTAPTDNGTATGTEEEFRYGELAVTVTVNDNRITNVTLANISETDQRSASIDSYAVPQLEREVIEAGSTKIDGVTGATFTSEAFVDSLTTALDKLGLRG